MLAQGHWGEILQRQVISDISLLQITVKWQLPGRYWVLKECFFLSHESWLLSTGKSHQAQMFFQFITQQLASMFSDIIRRDPAATNESPVSTTACWRAWNNRAWGMPFAIKKEQLAGFLTLDLVCLLLLFVSTSISRGSFTNRGGWWPAWNTYYTVTFNLSAAAFLLWPDTNQTSI